MSNNEKIYCLKVLLLSFSHVEPPPDNLAVNMLAEVVQIRNVRKVKVNAQVTFVIYVLEFIANWSIAIVWTLVHVSSSEIPITMGLMWFHAILPYIFGNIPKSVFSLSTFRTLAVVYNFYLG